ncbi:single-stranded-DNA-specific exonuclease RecJ [uncultured Maritalea sp.]|uniref:single-stranded-DNA-specific exonuclease RecJ n=1 Tax=uncultured Maritalea sp. TaxID=757249 RepID=UPI00261FAFD6|nr:single-stranded-DNA-specific exonuclease RecJ [uncultured Maritalea sp.]
MLQRTKHFLGVEKSISGRQWLDRLDENASRAATAMSQQLQISEIVARVMAGRGVSLENAEQFLTPTLRDLMPDPTMLTGMEELVDRLVCAVQNNEQVALFGDYDVDGATSVALITRYLTGVGLDPLVYIPDRIFEGYGPNNGAIDQLIDDGATLIVTLDCGTTSHGPIAHAKKKGVDILVIDHHMVDGELPGADGLVNPNRLDDISQLGHLCAAGVTFMVLVALNRRLRDAGVKPLPDLMSMTDLVALGTVCDVVPLKGLNRAFVQRGIETMRKGSNIGIAALAMAARVSGPLNPYHLGFVIGPRINAGGRIGDASLGAKLLSTSDEHDAMHLASQLDQLNVERQQIEKQAVDEAIAVAEAEIGEGEGPPIIVVASPDWHQGVVGLVAARLKERFNRPAFAIAQRPDGSGTGSGRSIPGVDLGAAVLEAVSKGLIPKGGGHAMAAGISVSKGQIGGFRSYMSEKLEDDVQSAQKDSGLKVDAALTARGATIDFLHAIEKAGPFGSGNPGPVFALPAHRVTFSDIVGVGGHVKVSLISQDRARINGIAFRAADTALGQFLLEARNSDPIHVVGTLSINHWQGREEVQLRIMDAAPMG